MATGSYMTPIYSRSQSEVLGDLHKVINNGKTRKGEERGQRNPCHWRSCALWYWMIIEVRCSKIQVLRVVDKHIGDRLEVKRKAKHHCS
ncbi:hypothetical protein TNCV_3552631 [Trichonephila clavipes]|nr:hypothetical protein TNCV_3552631 [Trichonephila clavipes]